MMSMYDSENKVWNGMKIPFPFESNFMVGDLIYQNLCKEPDRVLQICEEGDSKLTCEDLRINSIRIVQNMRKIGIKEDDVVCLFLDNTNFTTCVINACIFIGAILNPLNSEYDEKDLKNLLKEIRPKIIICEDENVQKISRILSETELFVTIYSTSSENQDFPSALDFSKQTNQEDEFTVPKFSKPSYKKILVIICSSGTTGKPKGACVSHANCLETVQRARGGKEIISTCYSPICWGSGFFRHISTGMSLADRKIFTNKKFDVDHFIDMCNKYNITSISGTPPQIATLLYSNKFLSSNLEHLNTFVSVGSILSKTLRMKFEELFPHKNLMIAYAMSEGLVALSLPNEYKKEFSVGSILFPNIKIKIVNEEGNSVDIGQQGEICIKMQFPFLGYYNNPKVTENSIDNDGFYKSGDIGYFDENRMLYIVDRKKDILKYKGFQLNPSDIENVIESIEGVLHVSVVGVPDELSMNLLTAAIVKREGFENLTEKDIVDYVASKLPEYKHLHGGVYFFDELPMTTSGKVQKRFILESIIKLRSNNYKSF